MEPWPELDCARVIPLPDQRGRAPQRIRNLVRRKGTARLVPDDDPRERLRYITSRHPIARLNTATVRVMQTALLTIRIDLNGEER